MGNGNRPTPEFRREAVRLALTSGRTRREIAGDLGIGLSTLTRWLSQGRDVGEPSEAPVDLHAELKRLRRENTVLKQERDILKKKARPSSRKRQVDDLRFHRSGTSHRGAVGSSPMARASFPIRRMCRVLISTQI